MKTKREEKLESELQSCRQALRQEKQKSKDLATSRDLHKAKSKELSAQLKAECIKKKRGFGDYSHELIARHGYTAMVVALCVEMYVHLHLGLRTTRKMLIYLNECFEWNLPGIPSHTSIKNWVEKCGYSIYTEPKSEEYEDGYAEILDESMMIASEKMLLTLGIPANKVGDKALTFNDVNILDISVGKSWNSSSIAEVLDKTEEKMTAPPAYLVSDNASTIAKAVRDKEYTHLRDAGHTLALCVERVYKDDAAFQVFTKEIGEVKFREVMRPAGYLLPPKQRTIARFMNLAASTDWAKKMLAAFPRLTAEEQKTFAFLFNHVPIITELNMVFEVINGISKLLKNKGLSHNNVTLCFDKIEPLLLSPHKRVAEVAQACINYLNEEKGKLTNEKTVWHFSSDVIESLFGDSKSRQSPNSLNGVTRQILILPLRTKIDAKTGKSNIDFKSALENVFLTDLEKWQKENLTENKTVKRRKLLAAS
jgi:transposase-like protein